MNVKTIVDASGSGASNPEIAVITPLLTGHKISNETKKTIKRNDIPYIWISVESDKNIPTNLNIGLNWLAQRGKLPAYYFMLDRDIELGRHCLDRLYNTLKIQPIPCAYAYASFSFRGAVNMDFPARPWDINRLVRGNFISSNSLFKSATTLSIGLVTDDKYKRLLDYAFLLKLAKYGHYGVPCPEASFIAHSSADSISAGSAEDYRIKYQRVIEDFVMD